MTKERLNSTISVIRELYREKIEREVNEMNNLDLIDLEILEKRLVEDHGEILTEKDIVKLIYQLIQD